MARWNQHILGDSNSVVACTHTWNQTAAGPTDWCTNSCSYSGGPQTARQTHSCMGHRFLCVLHSVTGSAMRDPETSGMSGTHCGRALLFTLDHSIWVDG